MFTLERFIVRHKGVLLYDCQFAKDGFENRQAALCSLVIGENGTGKSYLLSQVAEYLRHMKGHQASSILTKRNYRYDDVTLSYYLNGVSYSITQKTKFSTVTIDGKPARLNEIEFPTGILALSFMVNDKFVYASEKDIFYQYLGVRASSNATYTSSLQKKIFSSLITIMKYDHRKKQLLRILNFLEFQPFAKVVFPCSRKTLFKRKINPQTVYNSINNSRHHKKYLSADAEKIESLVIRLVELVNSRGGTGKVDGLSLTYDVDLRDPESFSFDIGVLEMLVDIGYLLAPKVEFYKQDSFSFDLASSGEKHLLFTMLSLIARVNENSLIMIDEPEISMHPSWQMKYVNFIKLLLSDFPGCHCILASHSHFMVSDLDPESSTLLQITGTPNKKKCDRVASLIDHNTYAWSAESILYNVFGLRTTRNYYFEQDIKELLSSISSKSKEYDKLKALVRKMEKLILDDNDPLNEIIKQGRLYVSEANQ